MSHYLMLEEGVNRPKVVSNYSTVTDLNKTGNYKSFQNLELRPFALKNFIIVNGIFLPAHNKEINTIIPIGPEPKRVSPSA